MRVGQTGSGAISDGPPATGAGSSSWCPRCDDLAEAAAGTPCAACATPRVAIGPTRGDPAGPDLIHPADRRGRAPAEPSWWLYAVPDADPATSAVAAAGSVEPDGKPSQSRVGSDPAWVGSDPSRVAPRPVAAVPPAVGQRWLVGLLVLVLAAGAVAVRGASFAPAERRDAGVRVAAPAPTAAQPPQQRAGDPLYGLPVVPEQAARPLRTLPARGPAPVGAGEAVGARERRPSRAGAPGASRDQTVCR